MPRSLRALICLLVAVGVGSAVVAWEDDRVEPAAAQAELIAHVAARAPAPAPPAPARIAPAIATAPPFAPLAAPRPPRPAQPPLSLAPKTSPPLRS